RRRHTRFSRDWSSDVCSSDLADGIGPAFFLVAVGLAEITVEIVVLIGRYLVAVPANCLAIQLVEDRRQLLVAEGPGLGVVFCHEIGRASCRERGESWGGGGVV